MDEPLAGPGASTPRGLGMSVGRLEAFSDGVFAIVITLLILDIKVPTGAEGHLAAALGQQWPQYVAYLSSFFIVGIIWLNHHATVNLLARTDHRLQLHNLLLLLPVSVLPWPTALLAEYTYDADRADQITTVLIYGLTSTAMAVAFNTMWRYLISRPQLHKPGVSPELLAVRNRRYNLGLLSYPVATAIGLFSVPVFLGLMFLLAALYLLPTPDTRS
ncbi:TMEM175 family protein [Actinomycetospora chiangmaiensis]|uniref:TMEM175 family protein n=1 Tax=Actinomycetospora chiangmaiensis TaxID=402650 RepID=UPI00036B7E55|nr:TMEM175 family protein [Actinomycetospora chiangmaiensis]